MQEMQAEVQADTTAASTMPELLSADDGQGVRCIRLVI
jgi:hypothetical protein